MVKVKLLEYLEDIDKSMYWLSKKSGVSYPTIFRFAKNKTTSVHFYTLTQIMEALGIKDLNKIMEYK